MKMARQGTIMAFGLRLNALFFAVLLLFAAQGWSACHESSYYILIGNCNCFAQQCLNGTSGCHLNSGTMGPCPSVVKNGTNYHLNPDPPYAAGYNINCLYRTVCSTQAEADSLKCVLDPDAPGCDLNKDVPSSCEEDYNTCVGLGGVWKKVAATNTECSSECNLCNSAAEVRILNQSNRLCCSKGKAPPDSGYRCIPPRGASGGGMEMSQLVTDDGALDCGALSTADGEIIEQNAALYKRFCVDGDEYQEQDPGLDGSSSSGAGGEESSSSEEGGSHSWANEIEGLEGLYGVLDTIRDTLSRRLTPATEEIRDCLYNWKACSGVSDSVKVNLPVDSGYLRIDTTLKRLIKPMMDSTVKIDSAQLKVLRALDSLYKRGLVNDSDVVRAVGTIKGEVEEVDSAVNKNTRAVHGVDSSIVHLDSSISGNIRGVREGMDSIAVGIENGIDSIIDSMTYYIDRVGDGLGMVGDSVGALRGDLNTLLTGTMPEDTSGDYYYGDYINGSDSMGRGDIVGVFGDIVVEGSHDSNFTGIFDTSGIRSDLPDSATIDSLTRFPSIDSVEAALDSSVEEDRDSLEGQLKAAFDSLKKDIMLVDFDSLILEPLGARVPNTNTCPEHCFSWTVGGTSGEYAASWLRGVSTLSLPLCNNLPGYNFNVFIIIRLIARIMVAIGCIYAGIWFIAGKKS